MNVTVGRIEAYYDDIGSGKVIVLLHGWGTDRSNLSYIAQELKTSYRLVSVDLPGFGETSINSRDWGVGDYVGFLNSFLKELKINEVYALVAHSFGGRVCIKGLSEGVLSADRLILIGSAGVRHSDSLRNVAFKLVAKTGKTVMKLPILRGKYDKARQKLHERAGSADYANSGEMRQIFLNTINEDLSENAKNLRLPTLLIWGSEDDEAPLADARFFQKNIPGSSLKIIQGAGHFVHNEHPSRVVRFIREFLS